MSLAPYGQHGFLDNLLGARLTRAGALYDALYARRKIIEQFGERFAVSGNRYRLDKLAPLPSVFVGRLAR